MILAFFQHILRKLKPKNYGNQKSVLFQEILQNPDWYLHMEGSNLTHFACFVKGIPTLIFSEIQAFSTKGVFESSFSLFQEGNLLFAVKNIHPKLLKNVSCQRPFLGLAFCCFSKVICCLQ